MRGGERQCFAARLLTCANAHRIEGMAGRKVFEDSHVCLHAGDQLCTKYRTAQPFTPFTLSTPTQTASQMLKAFCPVITMLLLFAARLERPTPRLIASILLISLGVCMASYGEMNMSFVSTDMDAGMPSRIVCIFRCKGMSGGALFMGVFLA